MKSTLFQTLSGETSLFTDLDPLGTGRSKPYMDRKDFFSDLKTVTSPKKTMRQPSGGGGGDGATGAPSLNNSVGSDLFSRPPSLPPNAQQRYNSVSETPPPQETEEPSASALAGSVPPSTGNRYATLPVAPVQGFGFSAHLLKGCASEPQEANPPLQQQHHQVPPHNQYALEQQMLMQQQRSLKADLSTASVWYGGRMDYADSPTPPLTAPPQQQQQPPPPQTASAFGQQQLPATNSAILKVSLPPEPTSQSSTAAQQLLQQTHQPFPPEDAFQMQQQQHVVVDSSSGGAASNSQSNKKDYYGAIPELERSPRRIGTNSSGTPYHHQEGSATLGVPPSGPQPQSRIGGTPQPPPPDLPPKVPERSDRSSPPPLPPKKPQHQQPSWPRYAHQSTPTMHYCQVENVLLAV